VTKTNWNIINVMLQKCVHHVKIDTPPKHLSNDFEGSLIQFGKCNQIGHVIPFSYNVWKELSNYVFNSQFGQYFLLKVTF
jgi:hypothetical protein